MTVLFKKIRCFYSIRRNDSSSSSCNNNSSSTDGSSPLLTPPYTRLPILTKHCLRWPARPGCSTLTLPPSSPTFPPSHLHLPPPRRTENRQKCWRFNILLDPVTHAAHGGGSRWINKVWARVAHVGHYGSFIG